MESAGFAAFHLPLLRIEFQPPASAPSGTWADLVVFVSANAVEGLERAAGTLGFPVPRRFRAAVIGARTRDRLAAAPWEVDLIAEANNGKALLDAMAGIVDPGTRVWIPAGSRAGSARGLLPEALEREGAVVEVIPVYRTLDRTLEPGEEAVLAAREPGAVICHSPSAAEALHRAAASVAVRRWWDAATLVAVGETTAARLRSLGGVSVRAAAEPSDAGVAAVLDSIEAIQPSGSDT